MEGIQPGDLNRDFIGNSWFVSAIAALAEFPNRIEKIFLNNKNEISDTGIYGVNIYTLGIPHTIVVDDYLPLIKNSEGKYTTLYAEVEDSEESSIWGPIMEKAFAKRYGNYEHIIGGMPSEAIRTLTGAPSISYKHEEKDADALWELLTIHDDSDDFITCGTENADDAQRSLAGLAKGHSYTVLGTLKLSDGKRLVKVRNAWGSEGFIGAYSDTSELFDDGETHKSTDDGIWFTTIEDYKNNFSETWISMDTSNWPVQRFLQLEDDS